jgi:hypothetical protein
MYQILGMRRHEDLEIDAVAALALRHRLLGPVQTVAFGSRPVVRTDRQVNTGIVTHQPFDSFCSGEIIRIRAHESVIVAVQNRTQIVAQHQLDDLVFMPQRNENGNALCERGPVPIAVAPRQVFFCRIGIRGQ